MSEQDENGTIIAVKKGHVVPARKIRDALTAGKAYVFSDVNVVNCSIAGTRVFFVTDMERDPIQRSHRRGRFFEPEELDLIRSVFPEGGTFVDIGANIGNHSLYVAKYLNPGRIIPFEPNPLAYRLLFANIALNDVVDLFDMSNIGFGASDRAEAGFAMTERRKNLGAAKMVAGEGDIETVCADDALAAETPDFIKIDVEGMEMQVLAGLTETIRRARPAILIEVDNANDDAFRAWVDEVGYDIRKTVRHYAENLNYFILPA